MEWAVTTMKIAIVCLRAMVFVLVFGGVGLFGTGSHAQERVTTADGERAGVATDAAEALTAARRRLPPAKTSEHVATISGKALTLKATAGALPIINKTGVVLGEIAYVSYSAEATDKRERPVVFAFNGGPGSASAWLHIGAIGPWRIDLASPRQSAAGGVPAPSFETPKLVDNDESWLTFADLVFVDPIGTGYSRIVEEPEVQPPAAQETRRKERRGKWQRIRENGGPGYFHSVQGDADSLARFIAYWLKANDREGAPTYVVGESYGGFRAPKIAYILSKDHDIDLSGIVLVSPVLDFEGRRGLVNPQYFVSLLPSLVATVLERNGQTVSRDVLADVESYARGEFVTDLFKGVRDRAAVERVTQRVAQFTGLHMEAVSRVNGRFGGQAFLTELDKETGKLTSIYDASVTRIKSGEERDGRFQGDPFTGEMTPRLGAAMKNLYANRLGWLPNGDYEVQSYGVNYNWHWQNSPNAAQSMSDLAEVMTRNGALQLLVVHGFTDLVTPYFASELLLDQVGTLARDRRVTRLVLPGGHMFYSRDGSRRTLAHHARLIMEPVQKPVELRTEVP